MSTSKGPGREMMQSALDQWLVVEQMQAIASQVLPPGAVREVQAATRHSAVRARDVLQRTEKKRTPTGVSPPDTEGELRGILDRLETPCEDEDCICHKEDPRAAK